MYTYRFDPILAIATINRQQRGVTESATLKGYAAFELDDRVWELDITAAQPDERQEILAEYFDLARASAGGPRAHR